MVPSVDSSRVCAFVVGIDEYDYEEVGCLKNGVGDAQKVEQALRKAKVERITSASNCTYEQLTDSTNQYLSKLRKGDVALVYLAAHAAKYQNQNVVLTKTSNPTNLAHTSLGVQLLLLRFIAWCSLCRHANCICCLHVMYVLANHDSIAQWSPKMTVLMLDACTVYVFNEHPAGGSSNDHGLNVQCGDKTTEARDYLFSRACAPNRQAADTGAT